MANATMKFGDLVFEITDPANVQPVSADVSTELREINGIICISFGAIVTDGDAPPKVVVNSRLRFTLPAALDFRNALDHALKQSTPSKEKTN